MFNLIKLNNVVHNECLYNFHYIPKSKINKFISSNRLLWDKYVLLSSVCRCASFLSSCLMLSFAFSLLYTHVNKISILFTILSITSVIHHSRVDTDWIINDIWRLLDFIAIFLISGTILYYFYNNLSFWTLSVVLLTTLCLKIIIEPNYIACIHSHIHIGLIIFICNIYL